MKVNCTWDDLYKAAMDKGYGEPELKAKDTARGEVSILMRQLGDDPERYECPEDAIEAFCNKYNVTFNEAGNVLDTELPKILVITPKDEVELKDYTGYESLSDTVEGTISYFHKADFDNLKTDMICNDEFLLDDRFNEVNAFATLLSGQVIYGNVAMIVYKGHGENRGFEYKNNDITCEAISLKMALENTMKDGLCSEMLKLYHEKYDKEKPEPKIQVKNYKDIDDLLR